MPRVYHSHTPAVAHFPKPRYDLGMKTNLLTIVGKILLTLLLVSPILGILGVFPAPTRDLYSTDQSFQFIDLLMKSGYVIWMEAIVFVIAIACLWTRRTALAALLLLPISLNIVGFHAFLDGGLLTGGAVMGNVLLLLNLAFLWKERAQYKSLLEKHD